MRDRVLLLWSGGKDSMLSLRELNRSGAYEIAALVTTVTEEYNRISMHGVRVALVEQQARSLGLPLERVLIPKNCSNEIYEIRMAEALLRFHGTGISMVASGDLFLTEIRQYREAFLSRLGMRAMFPLWKRDTSQLAREFTREGYRAITVCVDSQVLDSSFVGRSFDESFLAELPATVDPCGENGEFHTFVYDGPAFRTPTPVTPGQVVLRDDRFYYCDLLPDESSGDVTGAR